MGIDEKSFYFVFKATLLNVLYSQFYGIDVKRFYYAFTATLLKLRVLS